MTDDIFRGIRTAIGLGELDLRVGKHKPVACTVVITGEDTAPAFLNLEAAAHELLERQKKPLVRVPSAQGVTWIVRPRYIENLESDYARAREAVGPLPTLIEEQGCAQAQLHFEGLHGDGLQGALVGLAMAQYRYKKVVQNTVKKVTWLLSRALSSHDVAAARGVAQALQLARHLVNLPPNLLHPASFGEVATKLFRSTSVQVEIWNTARLKKEKMGLHLAVGLGAEHGPALVHLRYRPRGAARKPTALVGKGITFDSGGLDLKPASGMRWMKKDMGGAAAVLGAFYWATQAGVQRPVDAYLALAENAVDARAFRPGDIVTGRDGSTVEIHNTDAEGRLVLADALDVAVRAGGRDQPAEVINVATLTGAIKVALGADVAGLFCNDDNLARLLESAAERMGDPLWRMPLVSKYKAQLNSNFADRVNSADGFGGAITAALFLQAYVGKTPWAHFDIYAWKDQAEGALAEPGGSGQAVQTLIGYLRG